MITIYKITNLKNGKCYIEQTTKSVEERFLKHYSSRNEKRAYSIPLRVALREFDKKDFKITVLHTVETREEANLLEQKEIILHDSTNSEFGYNVSLGGIGGDTLSKHKNLPEIKEKIRNKCLGGKNVNAKSVKLIKGDNVMIFGSASECWSYLCSIGIKVAQSTIKRKCNGIIKNNKIKEYEVYWNKV